MFLQIETIQTSLWTTEKQNDVEYKYNNFRIVSYLRII